MKIADKYLRLEPTIDEMLECLIINLEEDSNQSSNGSDSYNNEMSRVDPSESKLMWKVTDESSSDSDSYDKMSEADPYER